MSTAEVARVNPGTISVLRAIYSPDKKRFLREPLLSHLTVYRALLMQFAHKAVAHAGVNNSYAHADFKTRALRTYSLTSQLFGTDEQNKIEAANLINKIHKDSGTHAATNPKVLEWVWATIFDSLIQGHILFVGPLTREEIQTSFNHSKTTAGLIGVKTDTKSWTDLKQYISGMINSGGVSVGDDARTLARSIYEPYQTGNPITGLFGNFAFKLAASTMPKELVKQYNLPFLQPLKSNTLHKTEVIWQGILPKITTKFVGL